MSSLTLSLFSDDDVSLIIGEAPFGAGVCDVPQVAVSHGQEGARQQLRLLRRGQGR
jgi:hypothetical protein